MQMTQESPAQPAPADAGQAVVVGVDPLERNRAARLSPFVSRHLGVHGAYSSLLPDLAPGAIRDLRDPDAPDDEDEA